MTKAEKSIDLTLISDTSCNLSVKEKLEVIESAMLTHDQAACSVTHRFAPGLYIREVVLAAGSFAIGHHQNFEHMNYMLKGRVMMLNEDGSTHELVAPQAFVGQPGRKIGFIIEETVWHNVYPTDETDIDKLEAAYITKSDSWKLNVEQVKQIKHAECEIHRQDFIKALIDVGISAEVARSQSENTDDQIDMPYVVHPYRIAESAIEGKGYFLTYPAKAGDVLAPARIDGKRTPAGRYVNHGLSPNATFIFGTDNNIYLISLRDIAGSKGGSIGDEVTVDYRQAFKLVNEHKIGNKLCQP